MLAIPDRARAWVYGIYAVVGLALGSVQVGYAAAELGQPVWLTVALAVFAYIGGGIGYTAATHTPRAATVAGHTAYGSADRLDP